MKKVFCEPKTFSALLVFSREDNILVFGEKVRILGALRPFQIFLNEVYRFHFLEVLKK